METAYQRSRIQEESLHYEYLKHTGKLPLIGVTPSATRTPVRKNG
jgi:methylmalonyl-CoA mutase